MCIDLQITDGMPVPCRNCWQCRENRVNDLVGRCIAEGLHSKATYAVTFTYREGEEGAAVLLYRDFQLFLKRLRRKGYPVRFIVAGEYGTQKGRAHWHAVLFFPEKAPPLVPNTPDDTYEITLESNFHWKPWPHGFVFFQRPTGDSMASLRYVMKYALKDQSQQSAQNRLMMSKKPLLGHRFICDLAQKHVDAQVVPSDYSYQFDHTPAMSGGRKVFYFQGRSREVFLGQFLKRWKMTGRSLPFSMFLEDERAKHLQTWEGWGEAEFAPPPQKKWPSPPIEAPDFVVGNGIPYYGVLYKRDRRCIIQWENGALSVWAPEARNYWHVDPLTAVLVLEDLELDKQSARYPVHALPQRVSFREVRKRQQEAWLQDAIAKAGSD